MFLKFSINSFYVENKRCSKSLDRPGIHEVSDRKDGSKASGSKKNGNKANGSKKNGS